jgi:hypothetical protein
MQIIQIFGLRKISNRLIKPDKESEDHEDMIFLSEIITNFIFLQDGRNRFAVAFHPEIF